jgi:hypothetical protein
MAIDIDDHHKKRKICTNLTTLLTTSAELYATFFCTALLLSTSHRSSITILKRSYATAHSSYLEHPRYKELPRSPGTSALIHTDENAIIYGDKPNCPAPAADRIGPMSERNPNAENAVDLNVNDDISDNGITVVNMSATTSIYSLSIHGTTS